MVGFDVITGDAVGDNVGLFEGLLVLVGDSVGDVDGWVVVGAMVGPVVVGNAVVGILVVGDLVVGALEGSITKLVC